MTEPDILEQLSKKYIEIIIAFVKLVGKFIFKFLIILSDYMNNLKLQYFVDFLLLMGWMPASEGTNFKKYQPPQRLGLPADYFLELPKDGSKKGFHQYAQGIVKILSKIYHCHPKDLQIVLEKGHDIFSMGMNCQIHKF